MSKTKDYYTVKEFAELLGYSTDRVYEWLRSEYVKSYEKPSPHSIWRIPKTELDRLKSIDLEEPTQREVISEAKEQHLNEIKSFIVRLVEVVNITAPTVDDVVLQSTQFLLGFPMAHKMEPVPEYIREHLPLPTLWEDYDNLQNKFLEYIEDCRNIATKIRDEGEGWLGLRKVREEFEKPSLRLISDKQLGDEPSEIFMFVVWSQEDIGPYEVNNVLAKVKANDIQQLGQLFEGDLLIAWSGTEVWRIAELESPLHGQEECEPYEAVYESMQTRFLDSEAVTKLITLFNEIDTLSDKLVHSLNKNLRNRDYTRHTCRLCPGQQIPPA